MSERPGLSRSIGNAFYGNFRRLHAIQESAIRPVLMGCDTVVISRTASGKTEAVLAPLVEKYLPQLRQEEGTVLLYVCPTRALANDLLKRLHHVLESLGILIG